MHLIAPSRRARLLPVRRALALAAIAGVTVAAPRANAQTVQGIVEDAATHQPVGGARLALLPDSGAPVAQASSDSATGIFYLTAPARGHYRVRITIGRGGRVVTPAFALDSDQVIERKFVVPSFSQAMRDAYFPEDVTRRAVPRPGNMPPRYPDGPRSRRQRGIVRALVVIDTTGRPDVSTFLLLEATNDQFADAVRDVLPRTRYFPAELDGRHVPQVTGFDVDFCFSGDSVQVPHDYGGDVIVVRVLMGVRVLSH